MQNKKQKKINQSRLFSLQIRWPHKVHPFVYGGKDTSPAIMCKPNNMRGCVLGQQSLHGLGQGLDLRLELLDARRKGLFELAPSTAIIIGDLAAVGVVVQRHAGAVGTDGLHVEAAVACRQLGFLSVQDNRLRSVGDSCKCTMMMVEMP
jgi:hypothetical protein